MRVFGCLHFGKVGLVDMTKYSTTFFAVCWDALHMMMMMSVAAVVAGTL